MKQHSSLKFIIILASIFFTQTNLSAQKVTEAKLLGCWAIKRFEFLQPMPDSSSIINESKGYIVCFEVNGKFITKQKTGDNDKLIGDGTYSIDPDGKTLHEKRNAQDDGEDEPAEIVVLTNNELALKVDVMIIHLERVKESK